MTRSRFTALLVATVVAAGGCRFWYKPVPVANAIGEERTLLAGDSVNVYRDDSNRFEVYGPNTEAVYDGYEQLNRAYRGFERHFSTVPPRLAFLLENDSSRRVDARMFRDRGYQLVRYSRPRSYKSPTRYGALGYGGVIWPIAPTAARVMLADFAQRASSAGATDVNAVERLPMWVRAAVIHLLGEAGTASADLEYVRDRLSSVLPLRDLLTLVRPAAGDPLLDPARMSDADEATRLAAAQAATFGQFLLEREGALVLGRFARGYLAGRSLTEILNELEHTPHNLVELENRWRTWVETREE
ncbi:MAG TPA: hypothetical protein VKH19_10665 [Gemmatimonadaceae bacterium]|nr:hypothetical protein [Gemmatimonadaceae bacterium]